MTRQRVETIIVMALIGGGVGLLIASYIADKKRPYEVETADPLEDTLVTDSVPEENTNDISSTHLQEKKQVPHTDYTAFADDKVDLAEAVAAARAKAEAERGAEPVKNWDPEEFDVDPEDEDNPFEYFKSRDELEAFLGRETGPITELVYDVDDDVVVYKETNEYLLDPEDVLGDEALLMVGDSDLWLYSADEDSVYRIEPVYRAPKQTRGRFKTTQEEAEELGGN